MGLAAFISHYGSLWEKRQADLNKELLLTRQLKSVEFLEKLIIHHDRDKKGLDKAEFIMCMLINIGAQLSGRELSWTDAEPFVKLFDNADRDQNGRITMDDVRLICEERQRELQAHLANQYLSNKPPAAVHPTPPAPKNASKGAPPALPSQPPSLLQPS